MLHQKGTISVVRGGLLYRENKKRFKERLKVISCWEDGQRKRDSVSKCHRDKRIGECVCSISIQMLNLRKSRISRK